MEEKEMEIEVEMNDPKIINPYEIEEGELPPPPADSDTSSDYGPEVKAEDEDENEATTVGTITRVPYRVQPFSGTTYVGSGSSRKVFAPGPIRKDVDYLHHKSVSKLEDQMLASMLKDKEENKRLKKELKVSQQEKEQMEQAFRHAVDWIRSMRISSFLLVVQVSLVVSFNGAITKLNLQNMPPKAMSQAAIERLINQRVNAALEAERASHANTGDHRSNANRSGGQDRHLQFMNGDMKKMMMEEFYPDEEVQRLEDELRSLKRRDTNIAAYTQRFNELVLLCPEAVLTKKKKVEAYIKGAKIQAKAERIAKGNKRKWENSQSGNRNNNNKGNYQDNTHHHQYNNQKQGNARAMTNAPAEQGRAIMRGIVGKILWLQAYVIKEAEKNQGPHVVMGTFLLNNHYATVLFDSSSDKSFVNTSFSHLIDIDPIRLDTSYEVERTDGRVASTNIALKGCTINLVDHLFKIDLMPIELGTFDVIVGMDWLVEQVAVIVCGKKVVHVPYKNKTLVVEGDRGASRLKVISCIKAIKYIERGSQLFVAHVTEKEPQEKWLEDVPVIRYFLEVFPDDLPRLPPPRQCLILRAYFDILSKKVEMSRDVLTVGSTMRIPLLYRGEYSQWVERFMNYLNQPLPRVAQVSIAGTTSTEQPPQKDKSMCNKTAKDLWDALARHMLGFEYGEQDRKAAVLYEYETFKATEGEL
nr:reverse transcriptase domain-containing protein [Tanacetum cinerariifolium]